MSALLPRKSFDCGAGAARGLRCDPRHPCRSASAWCQLESLVRMMHGHAATLRIFHRTSKHGAGMVKRRRQVKHVVGRAQGAGRRRSAVLRAQHGQRRRLQRVWWLACLQRLGASGGRGSGKGRPAFLPRRVGLGWLGKHAQGVHHGQRTPVIGRMHTVHTGVATHDRYLPKSKSYCMRSSLCWMLTVFCRCV